MIKIFRKIAYYYDRFLFSRSFSLSDQLFFAQRLSLLLDSNISLSESLLIIKNMESSIHRKRVLDVLILDINNGLTLSKSMKNSGIHFNPILITLISSGESAGYLSNTLLQAYKYLEKKNELIKKIINILIYPFFIIIATIFMTLFLVLYIFPKILPLLGSMNIKLPLITRMVKAFYEYSMMYGLWMVSGLILSIFVSILILKKSLYLKRILHSIILSIPILGIYFKTYYLSLVCNMGKILLTSGRSVSEMLLFSKDSIRNISFKNAFEQMHTRSNQGLSLSNSMRAYPSLFPEFIINMCSIGEKTGNLSTMLEHSGEIFEQDLDNFFKRLSSLIEPVLMILMGLIVGSIALSIILPVYEITNHLTNK